MGVLEGTDSAQELPYTVGCCYNTPWTVTYWACLPVCQYIGVLNIDTTSNLQLTNT